VALSDAAGWREMLDARANWNVRHRRCPRRRLSAKSVDLAETAGTRWNSLVNPQAAPRSSSRMIRRKASSNFGAFPSR
jgi:hypothetical protein